MWKNDLLANISPSWVGDTNGGGFLNGVVGQTGSMKEEGERGNLTGKKRGGKRKTENQKCSCGRWGGTLAQPLGTKSEMVVEKKKIIGASRAAWGTR